MKIVNEKFIESDNMIAEVDSKKKNYNRSRYLWL